MIEVVVMVLFTQSDSVITFVFGDGGCGDANEWWCNGRKLWNMHYSLLSCGNTMKTLYLPSCGDFFS